MVICPVGMVNSSAIRKELLDFWWKLRRVRIRHYICRWAKTPTTKSKNSLKELSKRSHAGGKKEARQDIKRRRTKRWTGTRTSDVSNCTVRRARSAQTLGARLIIIGSSFQ